MEFSWPGTQQSVNVYYSSEATSTYYTSAGSAGFYPATGTITISPSSGSLSNSNVNWPADLNLNDSQVLNGWGFSGWPEDKNNDWTCRLNYFKLQPDDVLPDELEKLFVIPVLKSKRVRCKKCQKKK